MSGFVDKGKREFLSHMAYGGACVLCSGALASLLSSCGDESNPTDSSQDLISPVVNLNDEPALQTVGGAIRKRFTGINGGRETILYRNGDTSFVALSAVCTHQGTIVNLPSGGTIFCTGHGSRFNANNGSVVNGPAASPLPTFTATYDAQKNTVTIG